jgi:hypothetical protein
MRFLGKILDLIWLGSDNSQISETSSEDPRKKKKDDNDVSIAHFEDKGGIYLVAFDWDITRVEEFVNNGFFDTWEREMENTGVFLMSGNMGKDGDVEVVKTSVSEVFKTEEDE